MLRSRRCCIYVTALLIVGLPIAGCSQSNRGQTRPTIVKNQGTDSGESTNGGQFVVVDGERVFVPAFYLDSINPLRAPEKVARDIVRGRKVIKAGQATSTFLTSRKGTEMTVDMIEFEPSEPQTRPEQISYLLERVKIFNGMIQGSDLRVNDTVSGSTTALLIALKILGRADALEESTRRQRIYAERILVDEAYQGRTDPEKQSTYEWMAFFAIEGLNEVKKSKSARTIAEREASRKKSRYYAELIDNFVNSGRLTTAN